MSHRLLLSSLVLALVPACRPSKAEMAAIERELGAVRAQQEEILQQLDEARGRDTDLEDANHRVQESVGALGERLGALEKATAERPKRPPGPDPQAVYQVEIGDAPVKGSSKALVTIVMWTDYQCPYCGKVQSTLRELERAYGPDLRFVHKHNPLGFHPRAMPAALAVEAARRQGKFWEMHDLLFAHQDELEDEGLRRLAKRVGLDMRKFKRDLKDEALRERILDDQRQGMQLGARGTPAFFINGRFLSGAQPLGNFEFRIDEELAKARALVAQGVDPEKVYEVTIAEGRTSL